MSYHTEAARWRALTIRDPNANGLFVYAVKSTNCYCRPTCPARLARRANVVFYKTPTEAEAAGFRACKRCKPQEGDHDDPQERAVAKACVQIEEALKGDNPRGFRLQDLAKSVGLTPRYFHKIFKDKTGYTPKEYAKEKMAKDKSMQFESAVVADEGQTAFETSDREHFNFNDLVDLDFDPNQPLDEGLVQESDSPAGLFGQEANMNIQHIPNGILDPSFPAAGLNDERDGFAVRVVPGPASTGPEWEPFKTVTPPETMFVADAALMTSKLPQLGALSGATMGGAGAVLSQDCYQDFVWAG